MATGLHLEQYIESLENLPNELQRNFHLMRDLDSKTHDTMKNIDKMADEYLSNIKNLSPEKRTEQSSNIKKMFNRAREYSDDKVQLAIQNYELVDKHIRRLDADLAKFEAEMKDKASNTKKEEETSKSKKRKKKIVEKNPTKKKTGGKQSDTEEGPKKRKRKKGQETKASTSIASILPKLAISHPSDVLDMPVDPNEPKYCLCNQVSYGEMIACDKTDCPVEWFHFTCVGLTTKPKGKWYCPRCTTDKKKK